MAAITGATSAHQTRAPPVVSCVCVRDLFLRPSPACVRVLGLISAPPRFVVVLCSVCCLIVWRRSANGETEVRQSGGGARRGCLCVGVLEVSSGRLFVRRFGNISYDFYRGGGWAPSVWSPRGALKSSGEAQVARSHKQTSKPGTRNCTRQRRPFVSASSPLPLSIKSGGGE